MKINENTCLLGKLVVLVPYLENHVPKYHSWMQSAELQLLTASEPLSLEQEYAMQQSWHMDEDKCTFIILDARLYSENKDESEAMVGDVNLFLNDQDDRTSAEVEIMVAEQSHRGKGLGKEAALLMMHYGMDILGIKKYAAKIGLDNQKSIGMFQKFGFKEVSRSEIFQEMTLELVVDKEVTTWLQQSTNHVQIKHHDR